MSRSVASPALSPALQGLIVVAIENIDIFDQRSVQAVVYQSLLAH